jgi:hypothetical protein
MTHNHIPLAAASGLLAVITLSTVGAIATQPKGTTSSTPSDAIAQSSSPQDRVTSTPARCQTSQLSVRQVSSDAGVGNRAIIYAFTNTSSSACTLYGYPKFELLNADGQPIKEVRVTRSQTTYFHKTQPHLVTLAPTAQASFEIAYNVIPDGQTCVKVDKVKITPPNADRFLTLTEQFTPCGNPRARIKITPVEAGNIQQ